jgi:hypothetical protein
VNYSEVRLWIPESGLIEVGAPKTSTLQVLCSIFNWVPNWISFLVCVEPYAPVIYDI